MGHTFAVKLEWPWVRCDLYPVCREIGMGKIISSQITNGSILMPHDWLSRRDEIKIPHERRSRKWGIFILSQLLSQEWGIKIEP